MMTLRMKCGACLVPHRIALDWHAVSNRLTP